MPLDSLPAVPGHDDAVRALLPSRSQGAQDPGPVAMTQIVACRKWVAELQSSLSLLAERCGRLEKVHEGASNGQALSSSSTAGADLPKSSRSDLGKKHAEIMGGIRQLLAMNEEASAFAVGKDLEVRSPTGQMPAFDFTTCRLSGRLDPPACRHLAGCLFRRQVQPASLWSDLQLVLQACVCTLYLNTLKLICTGLHGCLPWNFEFVGAFCGIMPPLERGRRRAPSKSRTGGVRRGRSRSRHGERGHGRDLDRVIVALLRRDADLLRRSGEHGWVELATLRRHRKLKEVSPSELTALIDGSERLVMSQDGFAVAACNGHSVQGVFGPGECLAPADVPEHLFHGSLERHRRSIMEEGLRGNRPVHLVDERFGKWKATYDLKVVVRARAASQKGIRFRVNDNGVYLAEQSLPPVWIAGVEHWPKRGPNRARGSIVQSVRESGDRCGTCSPRRRRSSEAAVEYLDAKASASSRASAPSLPLASPEEADVSRQVDSRALSDMLAKHYKMDLITEDFAFSEHLSKEDASPVPHAQRSVLVSEADIEGMATVAAWRSDNGFQESKDFAFAFTSETEARDEGGEVMVTAWLATRAQEMSVVGTGAAAVLLRVDEPVLSSSSALPSSRPKALPVSKAKLTAREATPAADDEKKRVVLGELFSLIRKTPTHAWVLEAASSGLTNAEFDEFLARRMQALLRFELRSLRSGQMAFSRLAAFKPGASLFGNPMLVEAYLASLLRPTSTYNSLYWVQRHLNFELGMLSVLKPTGASSSGAVGAGTRQAVVAEPAMLFTLGKKAEAFKAAGDVRWMALVVAHVLSSGTMGQRHLQRSRLVKLTDTAAFFVCSKGKTKARDAFNWSCPCFSVDGVNMMAMWHQEVRRLSDAGTEVRCLAFDLESGQPLAFSAMIAESPGGPKAEVVSLMPVRYAYNRDSIQCLVKLALRLGWQGLFEATSGSAVPCLWGNCLTQMRSWDLRALMDASAVALDGTVAVFEMDASEARKFVMAEDVPAGQVDADDGDSDLSPSQSCDEEGPLGKIFFSMAGQPGAKVHLHLQAWSRWDSEATPLCKRMQKASQPLAAPIAVGEGLAEAAGVGPSCADCARAYKSHPEKACAARDLASPEATFEALATEYEFDATIAEALVTTLGCKTLRDFRFLVTVESEIKEVVLKVAGDAGKIAVQAARVRRAWWGVVAAVQSQSASQVTPGDDLDDVLPQMELDALEMAYFSRYHGFVPPARTPADSVTSRSRREMDRRTLTLRDFSSMKSQVTQQHTRMVRRKIADGLYKDEDDVDSSMAERLDNESVAGFLGNMMIYLMSLAKAGVHKLDPYPTIAETQSTDSTDYVHVTYFWRASLIAEALPPSVALAFLKKQDLADRAEWIDRFRNSSKTLGLVIKEVHAARSAHWDISGLQITTAPARGTGTVFNACAATLRDNTALCPAFNSKRGCNVPNCSSGAHRCGWIAPGGRVCGSWGHSYNNCHKK
ncbi:unnamed protein product [Polarella glacialis]|uniref:2'-phosphotransferase n=1 Tax=Polarella glacialis TaxID=89957 RepID=A0A813GT52_POLGL|nr:unnamed protein product [Polarella glacialis]